MIALYIGIGILFIGVIALLGYFWLSYHVYKNNPLLQATDAYLQDTTKEVAEFLMNRNKAKTYQLQSPKKQPIFMGTIKVIK